MMSIPAGELPSPTVVRPPDDATSLEEREEGEISSPSLSSRDEPPLQRRRILLCIKSGQGGVSTTGRDDEAAAASYVAPGLRSDSPHPVQASSAAADEEGGLLQPSLAAPIIPLQDGGATEGKQHSLPRGRHHNKKRRHRHHHDHNERKRSSTATSHRAHHPRSSTTSTANGVVSHEKPHSPPRKRRRRGGKGSRARKEAAVVGKGPLPLATTLASAAAAASTDFLLHVKDQVARIQERERASRFAHHASGGGQDGRRRYSAVERAEHAFDKGALLDVSDDSQGSVSCCDAEVGVAGSRHSRKAAYYSDNDTNSTTAATVAGRIDPRRAQQALRQKLKSENCTEKQIAFELACRMSPAEALGEQRKRRRHLNQHVLKMRAALTNNEPRRVSQQQHSLPPFSHYSPPGQPLPARQPPVPTPSPQQSSFAPPSCAYSPPQNDRDTARGMAGYSRDEKVLALKRQKAITQVFATLQKRRDSGRLSPREFEDEKQKLFEFIFGQRSDGQVFVKRATNEIVRHTRQRLRFWDSTWQQKRGRERRSIRPLPPLWRRNVVVSSQSDEEDSDAALEQVSDDDEGNVAGNPRDRWRRSDGAGGGAAVPEDASDSDTEFATVVEVSGCMRRLPPPVGGAGNSATAASAPCSRAEWGYDSHLQQAFEGGSTGVSSAVVGESSAAAVERRARRRREWNLERRQMLMRSFDQRAPPKERMFQQDTSRLKGGMPTPEQQQDWDFWYAAPASLPEWMRGAGLRDRLIIFPADRAKWQ